MMDLTSHAELTVRQKLEGLEAFTGFETANRYAVLTPDGDEAMYAYEESGTINRQFMGSRRPLNIHLVEGRGEPVLTANRPFFWLLSKVYVQDAEGNSLGALYRQFAGFNRKFSLVDGTGQQIAEIKGSAFRRYTFVVQDSAGAELGRITKEWGGIMREAVTDADTFKISFSELGRDNNLRLLILASAFAIDLDFFEQK